jgi:hypothetical protein
MKEMLILPSQVTLGASMAPEKRLPRPSMIVRVYSIQLRTLGPLVIQNFPGIPLEGAFTAGLREVSCACRTTAAVAGCPLGRRCALHLLGRPLAEHFTGLPRRSDTPPAPVILRPRFAQGTYPQGAILQVEVVLIGDASLEWTLAGLAAAGRHGIGPTRRTSDGGRFEIAGVDVIGPHGVQPLWQRPTFQSSDETSWRFPSDFLASEDEIDWQSGGEILFRTPTPLPSDRAKHSLRFRDLVSAASRHISLLEIAYTKQHHFNREKHDELCRAAEDVDLGESDCEWVTWTRYSSRQDRTFDIQGWLGRACYRGDLQPFLPLLRLGSLVHITGHAIRGCGEIALGRSGAHSQRPCG